MTEFLKLKKSNCKNCYKCIRNCPVKSIRFSGNQAHIVGDECILCGQCFVVCPQNAKEIVDSTEMAKLLLSGPDPVIASIAPSFRANYDGIGIGALQKALLRLGFAGAEETAIGATLVKSEYDQLLEHNAQDIVISSCCPTVNLLIQKHFPQSLPYLAKVVSPMLAHGKDIKKRYPGAKTVFIGPCISKKEEADRYPGAMDCVLTFEELTRWLSSEGIVLEKETDHTEKSRTRLFPTSGGILKSMLCKNEEYTYMAVDGVDKCISVLEDIQSGGLSHCFIEMSACAGSCIGGPVMEKFRRSLLRDYQQITAYAGKEDFQVNALPKEDMTLIHPYLGVNNVKPGENKIRQVLLQMGKTKPEDELNCGTCGYNTCREKAIAVCQGKADLSMCLPFLKDRAESFSDNIVNNTPNGIIVLNEQLEVQQINAAALKLMNLQYASDVLGEGVIRLLDPSIFLEVQAEGHSILDRKAYLAEYRKYVEQTVLLDKNYHILICILRDVTVEETARAKAESIRHQTIEIADRVADKQMRVVQEIASLLGETAAETKIALSKLKESISHE